MHPIIFAGIITITCLGNSMEPKIPQGSTVRIDCTVPFSKLHAGQTVLYYAPLAANANWEKHEPGQPYKQLHTLVRKNVFGVWITKGINNAKEDSQGVTARNYIGVLVEPGNYLVF